MSGNGRETFPNVRELLRDTPGSLKVVGGPLDVREWSGEPLGCLKVSGRPSQMSLSGRRPFWMFGSCREAPRISRSPSRLFRSDRETLPNVREALPEVRKSLKAPWMSGSGLEALPDVIEWSGCPPECSGVVRRPSRMSSS